MKDSQVNCKTVAMMGHVARLSHAQGLTGAHIYSFGRSTAKH